MFEHFVIDDYTELFVSSGFSLSKELLEVLYNKFTYIIFVVKQ